MLIEGSNIYTANLGDSRAIIVSSNKGGKGDRVRALTYDHKPDLLDEKLRILNKGGMVATHSIASTVQRV